MGIGAAVAAGGYAAGRLAGLWGKSQFISNFEPGEYDPGHKFVQPTRMINGLAVYEVGQGKPILVFPYPHAGTQTPMAQNKFVLFFVGLGRKVITFDIPGAYASTREPQVSMQEMLDCGIEALQSAGLQGKIDVAGHSMGGLVALAFALQHPERVNRLVLANTLSGFKASLKWGMPGSAWSWTQKGYWQLIYWGVRLKGGRGNLAMHKRLMNLIEGVSFVDKSLVPLQTIRENDHTIPTPVRFKWSNAVWSIDYANRLDQVSAPTLIVAGRFDTQTPLPCAEQLKAGIPNSRLVVFERSGHFPFIEEKDAFTKALDSFLADNSIW